LEARTFRPNRVLGLVVGAVGLVLLLGLDVIFLLLLPQPPLGFANFLWGFLFVLSLAPIGLLAYRTYGVWRSAYHLGPDRLTIEWGARLEVIPLQEIKEALAGKDIQTDLKPRGIWWPGCLVGRLETADLGQLQFLATMPQDEQVFVVTESGAFAISPESPEEFRQALGTRLEELAERPNQALAGAVAVGQALEAGEVPDAQADEAAVGDVVKARRESIRPAFEAWEVWGDRWVTSLAAVSALAVAALFAYLLLRLPSLPVTMPLHFSADQLSTPDRTGAPHGLLILPLIGLLTLVANAVLGGAAYVWAQQRALAYFLLGSAAVVQLLLWVAALGLIARA
jgi:hypothetical protein